jgi:hypothetical protein
VRVRLRIKEGNGGSEGGARGPHAPTMPDFCFKKKLYRYIIKKKN